MLDGSWLNGSTTSCAITDDEVDCLETESSMERNDKPSDLVWLASIIHSLCT